MLLNSVVFRSPKSKCYEGVWGTMRKKTGMEGRSIKIFCNCSVTRKISKNWQETNVSLNRKE